MTRASGRRPAGKAANSVQRRAKSERTELYLLRTATRLFSDRGFHGTGIRDIAEDAGLAVSAMYYYASSKDEMLDAVMRRGMGRLIESAESALDGVHGPSERLATLVASHVSFHIRNPHVTRVVDQEFRALTGKTRRDILAMRDTYEGIWQEVLAEGAATGEFLDRGGVDKLALLEMCTGVTHWYRPKGKLTAPELCERFADMALSLVGATRSGQRVRAADLVLPDPGELLDLVAVEIEPPARQPRRAAGRHR